MRVMIDEVIHMRQHCPFLLAGLALVLFSVGGGGIGKIARDGGSVGHWMESTGGRGGNPVTAREGAGGIGKIARDGGNIGHRA